MVGVAAEPIADGANVPNNVVTLNIGIAKGRLGAPYPFLHRMLRVHYFARAKPERWRKEKPRRSGASSVPDENAAYFFFVCFWLPLR
jgi:hypothetical protein